MRQDSRNVESDDRRIEALEAKVDDLSRRIAELQVGSDGLMSKFNATTMFFENRVDLIYRRVCVELRQYLGLSKVDTESVIEADVVLNKALLAGFRDPIGENRVNLRRIVSGDLLPGRIESPITLWGFRLNRNHARETGDAVLVYGDAKGICIYGPYKRLKVGAYTLRGNFGLADAAAGSARASHIEMDIYSSGNDSIIARTQHSLKAVDEKFSVALEFDWLPAMAAGTVEFRVHQYSGVAFKLLGFDLEAR